MAANSVTGTVSGKIGPALSSGSISYPNITAIHYLISRGVVEINYGNSQIAYIDYNQLATLTMTISGTVLTIALS